MLRHKFKVGQLVYYQGRGGASGVYQVTQLLPQAEDEAFQYRIKSVNEPHERVVKEHELRTAA
jgi:thiamine monophosphate kinase